VYQIETYTRSTVTTADPSYPAAFGSSGANLLKRLPDKDIGHGTGTAPEASREPVTLLRGFPVATGQVPG